MRYLKLDSLRGLAALAVVFSHVLMITPQYDVIFSQGLEPQNSMFWLLTQTPLHLFVAAMSAVMLFFVLSGFVLALSFERDRPRYDLFMAQRILRLFIPFAASILLSALLYVIIAPHPLAFTSDWFNARNWTAPPTADIVAGHLAMLMFGPYDALNHVMWTLAIEMRIAIVFPLIVMLTRTWPATTLAAALSLMAAAYMLEAWHVLPLWADSWLRALRALWLFVAGSALALHHRPLTAWLGIQNRSTARLFWAAGLLALGLPAGFSVTVVSAGCGAILLIALVIARPADCAWLDARPLRYLGKMSYSLYLIHLPVTLAVVHGFGRPDNLPTVMVACVAVSMIAAALMHRLVEQPSHRAARAMVNAHRFATGTRRAVESIRPASLTRSPQEEPVLR